ncbi:hypothetical protein ACLB2K_043142 [Fragaria x ananassa]
MPNKAHRELGLAAWVTKIIGKVGPAQNDRTTRISQTCPPVSRMSTRRSNLPPRVAPSPIPKTHRFNGHKTKPIAQVPHQFHTNQSERESKSPFSRSKRNPRNQIPMALEWVVLGYAAGAEAVMVLLLTLPGLDGLRKGLVAVTRNLLKPFLSVVPFCLFLLMDIYWKYENRPSCDGDSCTPSEHLRHQKSIMKSQRNALLIAAALIFYWLLYTVTHLVVRIEQLNQRVERLKNKD